MRFHTLFLLVPLIAFAQDEAPQERPALHPGWTEVVADDFNTQSLDPRIWGRMGMISRKAPDWRRFQSRDEELVEFNGEEIILWGRHGNYSSQNQRNREIPGYACGSIESYRKFSMQYGYVEVRAKFDSVQGCWPAIWLRANSHTGQGWPTNGEIDIMEHLNAEGSVYQTLHYKDAKNGKHISRGTQAPIDKDGYNTYGVLWEPGAITFYVNGRQTTRFEKTDDSWPFDKEGDEFYLIIDQQIGGPWVEGTGKKGIDKETLAGKGAAFTIDYVRIYTDPKYKKSPEERGADIEEP